MSVRAWCTLGLLASLNFVNYVDRTLLSALVEPISKELSLSDTQIGLLTGFGFALVYAVLALPVASLADRSNRPIILVISLGVWSIMTAFCGFAQNFVMLLAARCGVGLAESSCMPASFSLIGDYFPHHKRALAVAIFTVGSSVGSLVGFGLGGVLYAHLGWRHTFLVVGLPGVALALLFAIFLKEPPGGVRTRRAAAVGMRESLTLLAKDRIYRPLVIANIFSCFTSIGLSQWLIIFFVRSHGMRLDVVGPLFGLAFGLGMVVGNLIGGFLGSALARQSLDRPLIVPMWSAIVVPILCFGVLWVPNAYGALGLTFVAMAAGATFTAPMQSTIQAICPASRRAVATAVVMLSGNLLGAGVGPFAVGILSDALHTIAGKESLRYALSVSLMTCFVAAWMFHRARHRLRHEYTGPIL